jgi:hypothetical protein
MGLSITPTLRLFIIASNGRNSMKNGQIAAAMLGLGLAFAGGAAQAQDFGRDYDDISASRSQDDSVALRFSLPLGGGERADSDASFAPRLSLRLNQSAAGDMRSLDVLSYSFAPNAEQRLSSPFRMNAANGDGRGFGGWIADHPILFGVAAGLVVWGVVEATEDDDDEQQVVPN